MKLAGRYTKLQQENQQLTGRYTKLQQENQQPNHLHIKLQRIIVNLMKAFANISIQTTVIFQLFN